MPKINGYQLCEKIKQDPFMRGIPVILLAGAFEPIDEEFLKQVNADNFIIKPFESQELISKLNAALTFSAIGDEAAGIAEARAVGLEETLEEDLRALEDIPKVTEVKSWPMEEVAEAGTEELLEIAEVEAEAAVAEAIPTVGEKTAVAEVQIPEVELPSKDELKEIFESTVNERISSLLVSLDIKDSLMPMIKDSVEKMLWEVAPDLVVERMLKDMLKGALESLTKEVEKAIWKTVPDLAEMMISKEIERIRSEF